MQKEKSPVKTVSIMMIITLAGKVLGLLRDRFLTVNYGSGMEANAFLTASRIPRVFFDTIFASAISACLIPVFSETLTKKGRDEAYRFAGNFISVMTALCALLTALGMIFTRQLTMFFADGYDSETAALCVQLTRIMMPTVLFTGIAFTFVGILQSLDEFNIPAAISLISNCIIIIYYFTLNDKFGIQGLAVTFLIAWLVQALVQIPSLVKREFRLYPSFSLKSEGMKKVLTLMFPVMVSTWILPINQTINSKYASRLFDGAGVTAIELAYNLYTVIAGVFVLSVTNYIFPRLSRENAGGDSGALKKTISGTMHTTLFIVAPMTVGLAVMSEPLISFIYGGGEFDAFSVNITSRALLFMSLGMIGYAVQSVLSRVYFAEQNGKPPLVAGAISIAINILLCRWLTEPLDVAGIAIASAVSFTVNGALLYVPLKKRGLQFLDRNFITDMLKVAVSTAIMGLAAFGMSEVLDGVTGKLLRLALPICAGALVYGVMVFLLRVPETRMVVNGVKSLLKRGDSGNE